MTRSIAGLVRSVTARRVDAHADLRTHAYQTAQQARCTFLGT